MQDPDTIRVVMRWADAEFRKVLSGEAVSLLRESLQNGLRADRVQEIVAALEIGEEEQG